jgi:DNA-binding LacI/PurR family transcriptional regulator
MTGRPRITLNDIAKKTGYHVTTVSMAVRHRPEIPAATRELILRCAKALGYRPDPMLSALSAYRQLVRPSTYVATLGWLVRGPSATAWRENQVALRHFEGVRARTKQLGYRIEPFWCDEPGLSPRRMTQILKARGIRGLILCVQPDPDATLDLDWKNFSTVAMAYTWKRPQFHRVAFNYYAGTIEGIRQLNLLGYERVGMYLVREVNARVSRLWEAGYLIEVPPEQRLPIFFAETSAADAPAFAQWYRAHRPDAILAQRPQISELTAAIGLRVPRDIGLAFTRVEDDDRMAGMNQNSSLLGETAVDMVVGMLHRNETGIPRMPQTVMIDGQWKTGRTVRNHARALRSGKR